mgnify:CR=1 FL=1
MLGQAQTGTGKTAAFALPLLSNLNLRQKDPQVLVLTPTRELAIQVAEAFSKYASQMKSFHVLPIYGGQEYRGQIRALQRGVHVVVGTPGRVMDHMRRGTLKLGKLSTLVLDEADEMLRMGFIQDVEWILEQTPPSRQIALFSATMPQQIRRIAGKYLNEPEQITIKVKTSTAETIRQRFWPVSGMHKLDALTRILEAEAFEAMLIFVRTKTATVELSSKLEARGYASSALNGDIKQSQRERTIENLKKGKLDILVATDVAARGLDVERISHVLNYDIPHDTESYVHRIGRTGRMGRKGEAWSFVTREDEPQIAKISSTWNMAIPVVDAPPLPEGVERDPIGKREDWDEVSDNFGMVKIRLSIGKSDSTKWAIADWITNQARIPDIVIGEISQSDDETEVEIHVEKVAYVIGVIKAREFNGRSLSPIIVEA